MAEPHLTTQLTVDFPELAHLSREDLDDILNDPNYFEAILHSLPRVKAQYDSQEELSLANETIARNVLALQDSLYKLRAETKEAFDHAKSLEARWKELEREQRDIYQRYTPQFLLMRLKHATTAQDDASEALATSFVQQSSTPPRGTPIAMSASNSGTSTPVGGSVGKDIDDFVNQFKEMRKTYHKRVMWGDRWSTGQVNWTEN
ncbi:hypothetical protein DL96DRAFT_1531109 [Flagelloscypha sp. PMI_526]|nr:hypothetical protein DL96DRAFT_1531109 [Flagelloscypha sp. PMI_526]